MNLIERLKETAHPEGEPNAKNAEIIDLSSEDSRLYENGRCVHQRAKRLIKDIKGN